MLTTKLTNLTIHGASASGIGTCLAIPELKVVLDIGYCSPEARNLQTVLVTHAHMDHLAGAAQHASYRSLVGHKPSRFVCGSEVAAQLEAILTLWKKVQGDFNYEIVVLNPDDDSYHLGTCQGGHLSVRAVPTVHRNTSQGYVLYKVRKKLLPEYQGLPNEELKALRKEGVVIRQVVETPFLAYMGDTQATALRHPEVQKVETLITECTFVGDSVSLEHAHECGHTHLKELPAMLEGMAYKELVLMHFSPRHKGTEIEKAVTETLSSRMQGPLALLLKGDGPVLAWEK